MRYELRRPCDLTPFDVMVHAASNGVIVAVPDEADAIAAIAAVFTIEGIEVTDAPFDTPSYDA